jgi:DNA-binding HxlR family transcriptional regulator
MNMPENSDILPTRKSYDQFCPMATALDFIGDRWTPLILRELLGGSARFHELRDGLPGIATNLLAERLQRLEADGLIRKMDAHNAALYSLTEHGAGIRPTLEALGYWGASLGRVSPPRHERSIRAMAMALQAVIVRAGDALPDERFVVEVEIDGGYIEIILDRRPTATARLSIDPDARVRTTTSAMNAALLSSASDDPLFIHLSGNEAATRCLTGAIIGLD